MTTKERFERIFQHKEADRVPVFDSPLGRHYSPVGTGGYA